MKARATNPGGFVPYRENELTKLMQDVLGGNAKTLMFVNASPSTYNMPETFLSLVYASTAREIKNDVKAQTDSKQVSRLNERIANLEGALTAAGVEIPESG